MTNNDTDVTQSNYFRPLEAARYLRISHPLLRKLERQSQGPRRAKLGRAVVYSRRDLDDFMAARVGLAACQQSSENVVF
jgi:predicted DNA-binding transcriptional regulator AlpA